MSHSRIDPSDAIILFADLQEGIADVPLTISLDRLKKDVLGLAKLAKLFDIPAIISGVEASHGAPKLDFIHFEEEPFLAVLRSQTGSQTFSDFR